MNNSIRKAVIAGFLLLTASWYLPGCKTTRTAQNITIQELRTKTPKGDTAAEYTVEGYFVNETVPMLITRLELMDINAVIPDSAYVVLNPAGLDELIKDKEQYYGSKIRLKVKIRDNENDQRAGNNIGMQIQGFELIVVGRPEILSRKSSSLLIPGHYNICQLYPAICTLKPAFTRHVALLYSGGYNAANAHTRYWNDLKFIYKTLKSKYGYTEDNIIVVYKNGVAEDAEMIVDYPASTSGLRDAIASVKSKSTSTNNFFMFVTNHGGGFHTGESLNHGGRVDAAGGDETDPHHYDEAIYYYNQAPNDIWDDSLRTWFTGVSYRRMIAVLEPCFSGGLLYDMRGTNRILISAANEFEYSWGGGPGDHDMFSYHFTAALNGATHTGTAVNADTNGDGRVSMLEAFLYAKAHDTAAEHPLLEDSGDGQGTGTPTAAGTDGTLSNTASLN